MTPNIVLKLRNLVQDNLKSRNYSRTFYTSKIFLLEDANVIDPVIIERNGEEWESENYEYNHDTGKLVIHEVSTGEELVPGENLIISYSCYEKYSTSELETYIKNTFYYLSLFGYETFTLETGDTIAPEPTEVQENLIALVASILIKGTIKSYRTPEFTIQFSDNLSIEDKIKKLVDDFDKSYGNITYIDLTESASDED